MDHCSVQRKSQVRNIIPYLYEICKTVKKDYSYTLMYVLVSRCRWTVSYAHLNSYPYPFLINI